jgi:hypothetical protein
MEEQRARLESENEEAWRLETLKIQAARERSTLGSVDTSCTEDELDQEVARIRARFQNLRQDLQNRLLDTMASLDTLDQMLGSMDAWIAQEQSQAKDQCEREKVQIDLELAKQLDVLAEMPLVSFESKDRARSDVNI